MTSLIDGADIPDLEDPVKKRGGGPRTPEGKEQSKRNSTKHGLRAKVLLPDDLAAAIEIRTAALIDELQPTTPYQEWLVGQIALETTRFDRCAEITNADLRRCVNRAALCWHEDRRMAVENIAARLKSNVVRVSAALWQSRQGAEWLEQRWTALGSILTSQGAWTEDQRWLAFDLLGIEPELREGSTQVPAPTDGEGLARLVREQLTTLKERREEFLDALDADEQDQALAGIPMIEDATSRRFKRYEASTRRALQWAQTEFLRCREEWRLARKQHGPDPALVTCPPLEPARPWWVEQGLLPPVTDLEKSPAPESDAGTFAPEPLVQVVLLDSVPPAVVPVFPPSRTFARSGSLNRRQRQAQKSQARGAAQRELCGAR